MSASPMARHVESKAIPIRRVALHDPSELPNDYSTTPGGTLFSTTPGGTKIVYEKAFLMNLRSSPIARTPPKFDIPEALQKGSPNKSPKRKPKTQNQHKGQSNGANHQSNGASHQSNGANGHQNNHFQDEEQFQLDM